MRPDSQHSRESHAAILHNAAAPVRPQLFSHIMSVFPSHRRFFCGITPHHMLSFPTPRTMLYYRFSVTYRILMQIDPALIAAAIARR